MTVEFSNMAITTDFERRAFHDAVNIFLKRREKKQW